MKFFICLFLVLITTTSYSQSTSLKVTMIDESFIETIPFAAVILSKDSKQIASGIADINGEVIFDSLTEGVFEISASYLGYEPKSITNVLILDCKTTYLDIKLKPKIISFSCCMTLICYSSNNYNSNKNDYSLSFDDVTQFMGEYVDTAFPIVSTLDTAVQKTCTALNVFPNPCSTQVSIESKDKINNIMVFDITGKTVASFISLSETKKEIDVSNLCAGTYFVKINDQNNQDFKKLIVSK